MTYDIHQPECRLCGALYPTQRWALGYKMCLDCGEEEAARINAKRCVVPMHKSNYFFCTDLEDLKGINNKGGQYR